MSGYPRARSEGILTEEVGDEVVFYATEQVRRGTALMAFSFKRECSA